MTEIQNPKLFPVSQQFPARFLAIIILLPSPHNPAGFHI
jgi:hypothetical protein